MLLSFMVFLAAAVALAPDPPETAGVVGVRAHNHAHAHEMGHEYGGPGAHTHEMGHEYGGPGAHTHEMGHEYGESGAHSMQAADGLTGEHSAHAGAGENEVQGVFKGPSKCFTPVWMAYEDDPRSAPASVLEKRALFEADETTSLQTYISESGRFRVLYSTEGATAVPANDENGSGVPDYVEMTARFADESFQKQVTELGFVDPTVHQGEECGNRIGDWQERPITIRYHSAGYYGAFFPSNPFAFTVHRNFQGFPPNTDPEGHVPGALRVTVAHELKHVIQYATNCMRGDAGNVSWLEMDATMMENVVYPQVNDYYNYITASFSLFNNPGARIPSPNVSHAYSHVTWSLFFAEKLGMSFWVDTWNQVQKSPFLSFTEAMKRALNVPQGMREQEFTRLMARNHLWHLASGRLARGDYGFAEAAYYPDAVVSDGLQPFVEPYFMDGWLERMAADRRMFHTTAGQVDALRLRFAPSHPSASVGVLAWRRDGSVSEWLPEFKGDVPTVKRSPFELASVDSFAVVVANADRNSFLSYELEAPVPEVVTLLPNYPNPFGAAFHGSTTNVVFTVPSQEHVRITVYDITGRRVAVLFDEQVDIGRYVVPFQARGLASGVYIYRLQTGGGSRTGKMTYIR